MIIGGKLLLALVLGSTSSVSATADIVDSNSNNAAVGESNDHTAAAETNTLRKKKKKNRKLNSGGKSGKSGGHGSGSWSSSSGDMYWYKDGKPYSSGWVSYCSARLTPFDILCTSRAHLVLVSSHPLFYSSSYIDVVIKQRKLV